MALGRTIALGMTIRIASAILDDADTCSGSIDLAGYGPVQVVATKWNVKDDAATKVDVLNGTLSPRLNARSYFADACTAGKYNNTDYIALPLLGKTLRYTTDLSNTGCGCNVALYLTNLHQNSEVSDCMDYYCDANSVCGVRCHEIDIQEANAYCWHTTLHTEDDRYGEGAGYGGGVSFDGPRDFGSAEYGPNGTCINTSKPFQVAASFPVDGDGLLKEISVELSQAGRPCNLTARVAKYDGNSTTSPKGENLGMAQLTEGLKAGMTPIASFWEAEDMLWMDGRGLDGKGPCDKDLVVPCPETTPFYDFSIEELPPPVQRNWFWYFTFIGALCILMAIFAGLYLVSRRKRERLLQSESGSDEEDASSS